ncbi:MAG: DUF401 family protein, partial [Lentisphaeria bacterium]|nr:DUF401 family protein [Lentisphaeria bacterium]
VAIAALPAIIGLLPMPGGAIFSAPLVDDCDPEKRIDGLLKTHINYWFRHVWEYWWPLYPGVLMLQAATGLDAWQLLLFHLPLSLAAVTIGYWFLLRHVPRGESTTPSVEPDNPSTPPLDASVRRILGLLAPVFAVIGTYALIRLAVAPFLPLNRYVPMIMGLAVAVLIQQYKRPLSWKQWKEILLSNRTLVLALLVTVVRVYGAFIEHPLPDGVPLVEQMRNEFNAWGIPITAVIMAVPFVCGVATGLAVGFVGASFPIVMSLLGADPTFAQVMTTTALAFGFGYMGMILSPVHICLIVTNEHFGTRLLRSLKGLLAPALAMLTFTFLYSRLLPFVL